jgi:hypothetical protein
MIRSPSKLFTIASSIMKKMKIEDDHDLLELDLHFGHGGARRGAGRPAKPDKDQWGRVSCILRHETIQALRAGAMSKNVGTFLQEHLDKHPLPTNTEYLSQKVTRKPSAITHRQLVAQLGILMNQKKRHDHNRKAVAG